MFTAAKLFSAFLVPNNFMLLLLVVGTVLMLARRRRAGRWVLSATAVLFIACALTPLPEWGLRVLEERFPAPEILPARIDGIVVLGGDLNADLAEKRHGYGLGGGGGRVVGFAVLARRYPDAKLVYTGGTGSLVSDAREADSAALLLRDLGLTGDRMVFERESRTTRENARLAAAAALPDPSETWLLVTSAYHMPRAIGAFRRAGWPVTAYPVGYLTRPAGDSAYRFDISDSLYLTEKLVHEILGLVMYRLAGYSDAFWPRP